MAMMHVDNPRKRGFLFWDELGCLARALGLRVDLFAANIPRDFDASEEDGLTIKELEHLITEQKCFNMWLDRTVNIHTDEWNLHVILRAIKLLNSHLITFAELHAIRVAYQLYEELDTKGMPMDEMLLQRAIKMCGRMISPMKMLQRLKHMKPLFEEEDRIQLHEFLDLILWCDVYEGFSSQVVKNDISKDERNMYKMTDFNQMLSHYDQLLAGRLDKKYLEEEQTFSKIKHGSQAMPKDVPPVNSEFRRQQVARYNKSSHKLRHELGRSQKEVQEAKAGYIRERPISAPERSSYDPAFSTGQSAQSDYQASRSVSDIAWRWIQHCYDMDNVRNPPKPVPPCPRAPYPSVYQRPNTAPVISESERMTREEMVNSLYFDFTTLEYKYQRILAEDMDYLLPGYREWREKNPKQPCVPTPPPREPREQIPSENTLRRLCYHRTPGQPLPTHARNCDARFRGWYKVRTRKGHHYVLSPTTPNNVMPNRLLSRQGHGINAGDGQFIYRHTNKQNVMPGQCPAKGVKLRREFPGQSLHRSSPSPPPSPHQQGSEGQGDASMSRSSSSVGKPVRKESIAQSDAQSEEEEKESVTSSSPKDHEEQDLVSEEKFKMENELHRLARKDYDDELSLSPQLSEKLPPKKTSKKKSTGRKSKSETSSETLDFNFLTAKVQKNGRKIHVGPKFITPHTPPTPPSILPTEPVFKPEKEMEKERERQVKFEEEGEYDTDLESSESEYDDEPLDLKIPDKIMVSKALLEKKSKKVTSVLEGIQEQHEPEATPVESRAEVRDDVRESAYQDIESSASKLWPKDRASSSESPPPKPGLLAHLDEAASEKDRRNSSTPNRTPTPSELSTSLAVRINPHTEFVRSLSAKYRAPKSPRQRQKIELEEPKAGELGVVLLDIPHTWNDHPWIVDLLTRKEEKNKGKHKTYKPLIKRGQGQISPRLKRKFETGIVL